jgi:hypothetical protein
MTNNARFSRRRKQNSNEKDLKKDGNFVGELLLKIHNLLLINSSVLSGCVNGFAITESLGSD